MKGGRLCVPLFKDRLSAFAVQPELYGSFQVFQILVISAHGLTRCVRKLCNRPPVYILELDDDVERLHAGIVGYKRSDAEGDLHSLTEIIIELLRLVKIQAVTEQKDLMAGSAPNFL